MKYRCECFEIDGILENPALAAHISSHTRYTIPGFGCDYHLCTFKDNELFETYFDKRNVSAEEARLVERVSRDLGADCSNKKWRFL